MAIDTDKLFARYRSRVLRPSTGEILIARLADSHEAQDDYTSVNCGGYGRVRRFENYTLHLSGADGPKPLRRGHPSTGPLRTQVFQLAACNWRCWYCFVDDDRLAANESVSDWFTPAELVALYLAEPDPPDVLDLSGGQPDLVPEWCLWIMEELDRRDLRGKVHVWMDDNLSTHSVRDLLGAEQIRFMAEYPNHSRVGCFKGYDEDSFATTTGAPPEDWARQFSVFRSLLDDGFDMYGYVTFTTRNVSPSAATMAAFVDRLQAVHPNLPLRTVPLRVHPFTVTRQRLSSSREQALALQHDLFDLWTSELERRFSRSLLQAPREDVDLR